MDSPSSAPNPPLNDALPAAISAQATGTVVVVAGPGNVIARDYVTFLKATSAARVCQFTDAGLRAVEIEVAVTDEEDGLPQGSPGAAGHELEPPVSLVLFAAPIRAETARKRLEDAIGVARSWPITFIGIVSSFRVHLEDPEAAEAERHAVQLVEAAGLGARVAVFRPGHLLAMRSPLSQRLRRFAPFYPLFPRRVCSCFIEEPELFGAIEAERLRDLLVEEETPPSDGARQRAVGRRNRVYTFLGANLSWREVLQRHRDASRPRSLTTAAATVLSWLQVGPLTALVVSLLARWVHGLRAWWVDTLKPRSFEELVALCHRGNIDHVRVVGYNNGVNHFGHRHPGKTIVSTVHCCRTARTGSGLLKADSGATIRAAKDDLGRRDEELYVVPNYSYVAIGTAFFVPIHGSAVDYATVADTVARVVLYDPDGDRIVSASRQDKAFGANLYNLSSRVVVLRLYLLTRPKSLYFVRREIWKNADGRSLLEALRDRGAANVEIRQGHAASPNVTVSKYYTSQDGPSGPALDCPRDALGRLWDLLEENPVSSYLMHALSRHVAWHTELFLTDREFELFWQTHAQVPLRKIQLRSILRDGMPHSPFRDHDCVSADLFLFRFDKPAFDAYVKRTFGILRTNPGKHSN